MTDISKLTPGQVLYTVTRGKMGNTTISTVYIHPVRVVSIEPDGRSIMASWNHNAPRRFFARQVEKWRVKEPLTVPGLTGQRRLATRAEIAAKARAAADTGASVAPT